MNEATEQTALQGTGRSTRQIQNAPHGAYYLTSGHHSAAYTRRLCDFLGRKDLKVLPYDRFMPEGLRGSTVVFDHDVEPTVMAARKIDLQAFSMLLLRCHHAGVGAVFE